MAEGLVESDGTPEGLGPGSSPLARHCIATDLFEMREATRRAEADEAKRGPLPP